MRRMLFMLSRSVTDGLLLLNEHGIIRFANPAACRLLASQRAQLLRTAFHRYFTIPSEGAALLRDLAQGGTLPLLETSLQGRGPEVPVLLQGARIPGLADAAFAVLFHDQSPRRQAEAAIHSLTRLDPLTGLSNRARLLEQLSQTIVQAERSGTPLALLHLDLDRFKDVNESLGHAAGDILLKLVAERLTGLVRRSDALARVGGDEFALLLAGIGDPDRAGNLATRLLELFAVPFVLEGTEVHVDVSIGIALMPGDTRDAGALVRHAAVALHEAKAAGGSQYRFHSQEMNVRVKDRLFIEQGLRHAFLTQQLGLVYQPLVSLQDGRILGAEALCRWTHPDCGPISPARFIPVAEQIGLIRYLGEWVLWSACQQAAEWRQEVSPFTMWVNVSAAQLRKPDFPEQVAAALQDARIPPEALGLELTESMLMGNEQESMAVLHRLKTLGVSLAIDDFGTGYSSLSYLRDFEVDKLKIDRAFVTDLDHRPGALAIVKAVIAMGHSLALAVNAEGIETSAEAALLSQAGCDEAQGYLFARPMPASDLGSLLAQRYVRTPTSANP